MFESVDGMQDSRSGVGWGKVRNREGFMYCCNGAVICVSPLVHSCFICWAAFALAWFKAAIFRASSVHCFVSWSWAALLCRSSCCFCSCCILHSLSLAFHVTSLRVSRTQLLLFPVFGLNAHLHSLYLNQLEPQSLPALCQMCQLSCQCQYSPRGLHWQHEPLQRDNNLLDNSKFWLNFVYGSMNGVLTWEWAIGWAATRSLSWILAFVSLPFADFFRFLRFWSFLLLAVLFILRPSCDSLYK